MQEQPVELTEEVDESPIGGSIRVHYSGDPHDAVVVALQVPSAVCQIAYSDCDC